MNSRLVLMNAICKGIKEKFEQHRKDQKAEATLFSQFPWSSTRAARTPMLSILGKDQNVKLNIQIHETIVGELEFRPWSMCQDKLFDQTCLESEFTKLEKWRHMLERPRNRGGDGRDYSTYCEILEIMDRLNCRVTTCDSMERRITTRGFAYDEKGQYIAHFTFTMYFNSDIAPRISYQLPIPTLTGVAEV